MSVGLAISSKTQLSSQGIGDDWFYQLSLKGTQYWVCGENLDPRVGLRLLPRSSTDCVGALRIYAHGVGTMVELMNHAALVQG